MKIIRPPTMVGDLAVVYAAVQHPPQWYVATADGILIFGPFSSFEEAVETCCATIAAGSDGPAIAPPAPAGPSDSGMRFRNALDYESDRGCALAAAAYLDYKLQILLLANFIEDEAAEGFIGVNGPIGAFSARITAAYLLGLIPQKAFRDLNLIRRIRNVFGHHIGLKGFEDQEIADRCRELYYSFSNPSTSRARFTNAVAGILAVLDALIVMAQRPKQMGDASPPDVKQRHEPSKRIVESVMSPQEEEMINRLGLDKDYNLLDLLDLAGKHGIFDGQPTPENAEILDLLTRLAHRKAREDLGGSEPA
jgi:DNA-binding MltR family transcriptional regulator